MGCAFIGDSIRMSETKIKEAMRGEPLPQTPMGNRVKLQVKGRGGKWHAIQSRPVSMGATVLTVGPHAFTPSEGGDGYVYLTAVGAVEPTYRMEVNAYVTLRGIKHHVQKAIR